MIGEFAFHVMGTVWGGPGQLGKALACHPSLVVNDERRIAALLTARSGPAAEATDPQMRMKARLDDFQRACWRAAGEHRGQKWGRVTMTEHVGELIDFLGTGTTVEAGWQPPRGMINPVDYFVCRCQRIPTIFILRDGRTCIPAKIAHQKLSPAVAVSRWHFSTYVLKRVARFTEQKAVVRLEDLLANPRKELTAICAFLGVQFDERMLPALENLRPLFPVLQPHDEKKVTQEPWFPEIADDLRLCGYLD